MHTRRMLARAAKSNAGTGRGLEKVERVGMGIGQGKGISGPGEGRIGCSNTHHILTSSPGLIHLPGSIRT